MRKRCRRSRLLLAVVFKKQYALSTPKSIDSCQIGISAGQFHTTVSRDQMQYPSKSVSFPLIGF